MHAYLTLTDEHLQQLQRERVHALELDHARSALVLAEERDQPGEAKVLDQLAELERRIRIHVRPTPEPPEAPVPVPPEAPAPAAIVEDDAAGRHAEPADEGPLAGAAEPGYDPVTAEPSSAE